MVGKPTILPKFNKPPVVEVLLGVQFEQLAMNVRHLGLLSELYKTKFPNLQNQPTLPHAIERKGVYSATAPQFLTMTSADQIPRLWMLNSDETELLQFQTDRFMRNWRRYHRDDLPYPSYDGYIRNEFLTDYQTFCKFCLDQGWSEPAVDQCEVTYVNHIKHSSVWSEFAQLGRVSTAWSADSFAAAGIPADLIGYRTRHELSEADTFLGYLYVQLDSAYAVPPSDVQGSEPVPLIQLQLTARGRPPAGGLVGVTRFMDLAHSVIVKSFADITTPAMHKLWERTQ